jgi:tRNA-2-methylthio-N6-dimethylallyladenosine synthase
VKTYFVETWGCQMNVLDTQRLEGLLQSRGLRAATRAEEADVTLLNTCSVREKAAQKVLSRLGEFKRSREEGGKPEVVGLCGCVAEQDGATLLSRSSVLSFVLGPGRIGQLPAALDQVADGSRVSVTGFPETDDYDSHLIARGTGARQYVTAIHGCNQHCTFCVVPYTRGHEKSRTMKEIEAEVRNLAAHGAKEVTLLGQTINAYRCPATGADLGDLLGAVSTVEGLWRTQFITSHPAFFTDALVAKLAGIRGLGTYLHVPFQSGSSAVLKRMHRGYTREQYLELIARLRKALPGIALSTDVIVGFPGETEEDFSATLELISQVRFGQLYGFVYSPRPRTPAARYGERVARDVAGDRLGRLFAAQSAIQLTLNQALIDRRVEILIDGPAKRGSGWWQGRGADNRVVNVPAWKGIAEGQLAVVTVTGATAHALLGERAPDA